jgi:hypothetical protein
MMMLKKKSKRIKMSKRMRKKSMSKRKIKRWY